MKTALIGLGRIGWGFHRPRILEHDGFELCAVVDTSLERLSEAKELHGVDGYTDYKEMLAKVKPELVVIASPTIFHEEHAIAAMEAGAHVLLDKPMTMDYESALRIVAAKERTGRKLVIYQPHRFKPAAIAAKAIIESGKLGTIFQMRTGHSNFARRNDWQAFRKNGGGMLSNYGAHYIDEMIYLAQSDAKDYTCKLRKILSMGDAEDVVHILMQTENGILINIDINQATSISDNSLRLYGSNGTAILSDSEGDEYYLVKYCDPTKFEEKTATEEMIAAGRKYPSDKVEWITEKYMLKDFPPIDFYAECEKFFIEDGPSPVPLKETLRIMELIDLGYKQNPVIE